jgi:orotate phosphoribosyltransferase
LDKAEKRQLAADLNAAAKLRGQFVLRSGQTATEYFDKYRFESNPALLLRVAVAMMALVPAKGQVLAGLELGGVPIATAMSLVSGLPVAFVRKEPKPYGTCLAVEGQPVAGKRVVIVEDVVSTGGAVRDGAARLAEAGATLIGVVCTLWRGVGPPRVEGLDAPLYAVFTAGDLG